MPQLLKLLGYALIILGILQMAAGFITQDHINTLNAKLYLSQQCSPQDPTCPILSSNVELHVAYSWFNALVEMAAGAWLAFAYKEKPQPIQKPPKESQEKASSENLEIFLKGLSQGEQKIMRQAYSKGSIRQSDLQQTTGFSKAKISLLIARLEQRGLIKKEPKGKTNEITPVQKF